MNFSGTTRSVRRDSGAGSTRLRSIREDAVLLDPGMAKVNSAEIYRRVPGIEVIERKFGSERTGWLFS